MRRTASTPQDVVIVGAGIAGIATAWSLAQRGGARIALVDTRTPLSLTSRRPEASYRTWWPHPAMVGLAMRSLQLIEELRADGAMIPMDRRGYLYVSDDLGTAAELPARVARHPATPASDAVALDHEELQRRWPHLAPTVLGGILVQRAGSLDAVALGAAMLQRALASGIRLVRGEVVGIAAEGGRIAGLTVRGEGDARIPADIVVDAAGPFAREVARRAGADLPLETVLRQKVVVRDLDRVIPRGAPFTITLDGRSLDWTAAERGRLASDPRTRRLLDRMPPGIHLKPDDTSGPDAIKLGWAWDQTPSEPTEDPACPPAFPRMVLLGASMIVPGLAAYAERQRGPGTPVAGHDGGFYARTPDGMPLIGQIGDGAPVGLVAVAGLAGFGAMMGAAAGELAADRIVTGRGVGAATTTSMEERTQALGGSLASAFDPSRFGDPGYLEARRARTVATGEL